MRRGARLPLAKQFLPGGVYDANAQLNKQKNQFGQPVIQKTNPGAPAPAPDPAPIPPKLSPQNVTAPAVSTQNQQAPEQSKQVAAGVEIPEGAQIKAENLEEPMTDQNAVDNEKRANKTIFKTIFLKRKKSSVRLREKKMRQNRQLRKALLPKNALMALNEVKGVNISDFIVSSAANNGFTAVVTVNDKQYEGRGHSKMAAKNDACEKALRDYVIEKMQQHPRHIKKPMDAEGMETEDNNGENGNSDNADDVPMINLASFALYKLFSVWESEGFTIPEMHASGPNMSGNASIAGSDVGGGTKEPHKPTIRTELPAGWENMHPATLLCMMRPGLTYHDTLSLGDNSAQLQFVYVVVDDIRFDGAGRSKKIARRNAAAAACNQMFNTNFIPLE